MPPKGSRTALPLSLPLSREANAARMREEREAEAAREREKKVVLQSEVMPNLRFERNEARAKARSEARSAPVPPEEEAALAATPSAKVSRAKKRIFDFKVIFHDSLPKQSCAIKANAARQRGAEAARKKKVAMQIIQALEASHNGELNAELRAVIRAASESDASCAQIVGAWATSANVIGCERLFAMMYGGEDASPAERNEALGEAQKYIEQATAAIEKNEEAIARGYLDDRDPKGTVLSCACCGKRERENVGKFKRLPMSDLEVLAVNTDFEADRKTVATICKVYGAFRTEDMSDPRADGTFCCKNYAYAFSVYLSFGAGEFGFDCFWSQVVHTVLTGPESYFTTKFLTLDPNAVRVLFNKEVTKLAFNCDDKTSDEYMDRLIRYGDKIKDNLWNRIKLV